MTKANATELARVLATQSGVAVDLWEHTGDATTPPQARWIVKPSTDAPPTAQWTKRETIAPTPTKKRGTRPHGHRTRPSR